MPDTRPMVDWITASLTPVLPSLPRALTSVWEAAQPVASGAIGIMTATVVRPSTAGPLTEPIHGSFESRHGILWVGKRDSGVPGLDAERYSRFTAKEELGGNLVQAIVKDDLGLLWCATDGAALRHSARMDGLASEQINGLLAASDGTLRVDTPGGLCRFDGTRIPIPDRVS